jgi:hypothetical protein
VVGRFQSDFVARLLGEFYDRSKRPSVAFLNGVIVWMKQRYYDETIVQSLFTCSHARTFIYSVLRARSRLTLQM